MDLIPKEGPVSSIELKLLSLGEFKSPHFGDICKKGFSTNYVLNRQMKIHLNKKAFTCAVSGETFIQKIDLRRHAKTHPKTYNCKLCSMVSHDILICITIRRFITLTNKRKRIRLSNSKKTTSLEY